MSGNRCETVYFMMRRKLLHRMKKVCGTTSHMVKDELRVGEHQVDGTLLLIYIYICDRICENRPIHRRT